jgi:hypothetical protein
MVSFPPFVKIDAFTHPGPISIDFEDSSTAGNVLADFTGVGDTHTEVVFTLSPPKLASSVSAATLDGSITYHYTIPEPSTWAMMLIGFAGLGYAGYRAQRKSTAAA